MEAHSLGLITWTVDSVLPSTGHGLVPLPEQTSVWHGLKHISFFLLLPFPLPAPSALSPAHFQPGDSRFVTLFETPGYFSSLCSHLWGEELWVSLSPLWSDLSWIRSRCCLCEDHLNNTWAPREAMFLTFTKVKITGQILRAWALLLPPAHTVHLLHLKNSQNGTLTYKVKPPQVPMRLKPCSRAQTRMLR